MDQISNLDKVSIFLHNPKDIHQVPTGAIVALKHLDARFHWSEHFVRVSGPGQVNALGAHYRDPAQLDAAPSSVTRIDSAEATRQAAIRIYPTRGETTMLPVYVHDGPPGRETWLVEVLHNSCPVRWIFIVPGSIYERPAGSTLDITLE